MQGHARLWVERPLKQNYPCRLRELKASAPMALRKINPQAPEPLVQYRRDAARVMLASRAAGPVGGDTYTFDIHVGEDSSLVLKEASAMLILPGPTGAPSRMQTTIHVAAGACLSWVPELLIAARDCNHTHEVCIKMEEGARLYMSESILLGRSNEDPGNFSTNLRIEYGGRPIYHQTMRFGPNASAWNSAAVTGSNRTVGSAIAIDPDWAEKTPPVSAFHPDAVLAPLPGPGVAITAVARDSHELKQRLSEGLEKLGQPWSRPG